MEKREKRVNYKSPAWLEAEFGSIIKPRDPQTRTDHRPFSPFLLSAADVVTNATATIDLPCSTRTGRDRYARVPYLGNYGAV